MELILLIILLPIIIPLLAFGLFGILFAVVIAAVIWMFWSAGIWFFIQFLLACGVGIWIMVNIRKE